MTPSGDDHLQTHLSLDTHVCAVPGALQLVDDPDIGDTTWKVNGAKVSPDIGMALRGDIVEATMYPVDGRTARAEVKVSGTSDFVELDITVLRFTDTA